MPTSTITLPAGFTDNMLTVASNMITSFSPLIYTIVGVLMAVVVIEILIGIFRKH